jgi:type IV secretory pathway VirB4 component
MNGKLEDEEEDELLNDINTLGYEITEVFVKSKKDVNVCVYALVRLLVIATYRLNISKPHLLNMISEEWESLDAEISRKKNGNNN